MYMRRPGLLLTVLLVAVYSVTLAQSLSVESFRVLETDLTANTFGTIERDQNGEVAALIKVVTSETGFVFDGGMMGIVKTVQKTGEIWVYVPRAIQKITITHQQHGVLRDYFFPLQIESARTYEMILRTPNANPVNNRSRAQYVVFKVEPFNAVVLVDNEAHTLNSEGQLSIRLNPGEHSYMVTAPSYETESGTLSVGDSRIVKEISLSSLIGMLTINTDNDAQVFLNDEMKSYGSWSGSLNEGIYFVEVKRPSFRTVSQEVSLRRSENRTLTLHANSPAFGELEVTSDPLDFDIYIDGEKKGVTPDIIGNIRTGSHIITIKKTGYYDRNVQVVINEDELASVSITDVLRIPESAREKKKREARELKEAKAAAKQAVKLAKKEAKEVTTTTEPPKTKNPSQRNNSYYVGGFYTPYNLESYGVEAGFYINHFNLQVDYGFHNKRIEGIWPPTMSPLYDKKYDYTWKYNYTWKYDYTLSVRLGYGINVAGPLRLTPQIGVVMTRLRYVEDELMMWILDKNPTTYCIGAQAGAKLELNMFKHLSIFATPSYTQPLKWDEMVTLLKDNGNDIIPYAGGFKVQLGLNVIF